MTKVAALLLALLTVGLIARLDRDGVLAHPDLVMRAFGVELRVDVMLHRSERPAAASAASAASAAPPDSLAWRVPSCE